MEIFRSLARGKLLITGEYFVLDGAKALACPCIYGQEMWIEKKPSEQAQLKWTGLDHQGEKWLDIRFNLPDLSLSKASQKEHAEALSKILKYITNKQPLLFEKGHSYSVCNQLEFDRQFGLGSSSTLLYNTAKWAGLDPYDLSENSFGGSGYDIACAGAEQPILYQIKNKIPQSSPVGFKPTFHQHIYFLYLGKKQNSRDGIKRYKEMTKVSEEKINYISSLTDEMLKASDLKIFEEVMQAHESYIAENLKLPKVKDVYFKDLPCEVKSLGAWGGDFVMMTFKGPKEDLIKETQKKGFTQLFSFDEIIKT